MWQQLVGECVLHLHSPAFREEFYGLIRNDEIYIRLFCLHLFLLADRMRKCRVKVGSHGLSTFMEHKNMMLALGARRFGRDFYQKTYQNFHSHLPEELFYDDFVVFFKDTNKKTQRALSRAFKEIDAAGTDFADDKQAELLAQTVH